MTNQDIRSERAPEPLPIDGEVATSDAVAAIDSTEINGPKGPEPTRFGDWERKGRCIDF